MRKMNGQAISRLDHSLILKEEVLPFPARKYWINAVTLVPAGFSSSVENKVKDVIIWFQAVHTTQGPCFRMLALLKTKYRTCVSFDIILMSSSQSTEGGEDMFVFI